MIFGLICATIAGAALPMMTIIFGQLLDYFSQFQTKQISELEFTHQINYYTLFFIYLAIITFFTSYFFWAVTSERQNIAYFDKLGAGEVTTRITNDTHLIQDGISEKVSMAFSKMLKKASIKASTLNGLYMGFSNFFIYSTYALAFWYDSTLIISGETTVGAVVNVFLSVLAGTYALNSILPDLVTFNNAQGAGNKIFETINRISPINIESEEGVKLDEVEEAGTTVALVGSSGSGKSTIVSLVFCFYDPIEGEILFDGHAIKELNLKWLRRQMSLVEQEPVLFDMTIKGNVAHGLIGSIYENVDKAKKHEMIIQKILLLDEATSALDTQSESIVQDALDKASKNRMMIIIAHKLSTILNATKIIVMNNGKIAEIGNHDELIQNQEGICSKLVSAQEIQHKNEEIGLNKETFDNSSSMVFEENSISKVITNRSSKIIFSNNEQINDIEKGNILDYKYTIWELIKKIGNINRPEWYLIASFICGIVYPLFSIIYGKVINAFAEPENELRKDSMFWPLIFFIVGIVIIVDFVQGFCFGMSGKNLVLRIRSMSFAAILRQDISFFDKEDNNVGALSMNATDISGLAGVTLGTILQILATIIVGIIVALIVGWKLTLVVMTAIPLLIAASYYRLTMMSDFKECTQKAHEKSAQIACEGTSNIPGYRNAIFGSITYGFAFCINSLANALAIWYESHLRNVIQ
ncbi:hypothetical protein C1645_836576 [Glomus cerebriforme]|uniref:P-loop containing nucleoside triphosphate hydrolase protein n=1 Tax=Glomus cerebriforme TaxID=658196 RepID=A0A397SAC5_9GLOM|nr:hypothetical protein C1645_836576 [Glomus cerebriforme]